MLRFNASGYHLPMRSLEGEKCVRDLGDGGSKIYMALDYEAKFGPLGWPMCDQMMPPKMRGLMRNIPPCLAPTMPVSARLSTICGLPRKN